MSCTLRTLHSQLQAPEDGPLLGEHEPLEVDPLLLLLGDEDRAVLASGPDRGELVHDDPDEEVEDHEIPEDRETDEEDDPEKLRVVRPRSLVDADGVHGREHDHVLLWEAAGVERALEEVHPEDRKTKKKRSETRSGFRICGMAPRSSSTMSFSPGFREISRKGRKARSVRSARIYLKPVIERV